MLKEIDLNEQKHALSVLCRLDRMRKDTQHCDFIIKVDAEEINVHRNIISATSDYFNAMLSHDTKENRSGIVTMIGVDFECMQICVIFMYTGKASVCDDKYEELMHAANLLQLQPLCDGVANVLEKNIDTKTFFTMRRIADMYGCKKLEEKCNEFARNNLASISNEEEFGDLDEAYIRKLMDPNHPQAGEKEKLDALLNWVKFDSDRIVLLTDMLELVSLINVPAGYRRFLIEDEPLLFENCDALKALSISVMDSLGLHSTNWSGSGDGTSICVFDKNSGYLRRFNSISNEWIQMHEMNDDMKRNRFSTVSIESYIYVFMGSKTVYKLKFVDEEAKWERCADMLEDHGWCPPITAFTNMVFVVGGHNHCTTKMCEVYNTLTNQWAKITDRHQPSQFAEILGSQGCVYSLGGRLGGTYMDKVSRYDPATSTWTVLSPMSEAKGGVGAVEVDEKIYVFGGHLADYKELNTVECYDITKNAWIALEPMNDSRSWFKVHAIDGYVYAVGGYRSLDHIERINVLTNEREIIKLPASMNIWGSVKIKL